MFPQLVCKNRFLILSNGTKLTILDSKKNLQKEIEGEFCIFNDFLTQKKQLFKYDSNLNPMFVCETARLIYSIDEIGDTIFYLDRIGNLYKVLKTKQGSGNKPHAQEMNSQTYHNTTSNINRSANEYSLPILIGGNFSPPRGMCIFNQHVYLADKYGRVRKLDFNGEIKNVHFTEEILGMAVIESEIWVFLKDKIELLSENFNLKACNVLNEKLDAQVKVKSKKNGHNVYLLCRNELFKYNKDLEKIKSGVADFDIKDNSIVFADKSNVIGEIN